MKLLETLALDSLSAILEEYKPKPRYDSENKTPAGSVKSWFDAMGVDPEHVKEAMNAAKELASYKKLLQTFKATASAAAAKNGTFQFKNADNMYSVYGNGVIRQESQGQKGYNHYITKLKAPKPALVHGSPVKSLIKIYDNAFKELGSKKLKEDLELVEENIKAIKIKNSSGFIQGYVS